MSVSLAAVVVAPALLWATVSDLLYRRISNVLILMLTGTWLATAIWDLANDNATLGTLSLNIGVALSVLIAGFVLFALGWMGGGDAKLMAALCLWLDKQALAFLMVTALAGGMLAIMLPLLRMVERSIGHGLMRINAVLPGNLIPLPQALTATPSPGLPYALAIAAGAAYVLWGYP